MAQNEKKVGPYFDQIVSSFINLVLNIRESFLFVCIYIDKHKKQLIKTHPTILAPFVQKLDSAIHWIKLYPMDNAIGFPNTYPLDSDLSSG